MLSTHRITKLLLRRLPVLVWLPKYNKQDAISDLIAGITVGLTLMPQAIAYAALAGLEPQYGLYSGCVGILMYIIFGSTRQITIGPTALLSLLTYNYTHGFGGATHNHDVVVLFTFLVGVIELLCGIFQLGFLVNFVSTPVISGFTSAAALIIASAQMKNLFGLSYNAESFVNIWSKFFKHKSETKVYDLILGISCMLVLVMLKKLNTINFGAKNSSKVKRLKKVFWVISTGRNALVVVMCASLSYYFQNHLRITPFTLTGNIASGMPSLKLPKFSTVANGTEVGFVDMVSYMGSGLVVAPLIGVISNLALAKAFSNGGQVDATQEMIALGMCNIVGSFARSMPVAGAFSRSAVNTASGVRTTFGCVYTSLLVLLTLSFLTPYFYYIPRASLAAVIVTAVLIMIDINIIIKPIWSIHKLDLLPGFITFIFCLFIGIEVGLVIGVSIDMILILYNSAKPTVSVENVDFSPSVGGSYWFVTINYDTIPFPAIDHIRSNVFSRTSLKKDQKKQESSGKTVVINSLHMKKIDFTSAQGLNTLLSDLSAHNIELVLLIRNQQNLVLSISRLCPDLKIVSSIDELESMILKSKDLNNKARVFDVIENNCNKINDESIIRNDKVSINMVSEETRF